MGTMDSVMAFLQSLQGFEAYALLLGLLVGSGFGLPVNEDILLIGAAALTLKGVVEPLPLVAVAWLGLMAADSLVLHWGHRFGGQLLRHRRLARLMPETRLAAMQRTMVYGVRYVGGRWEDIVAVLQRFQGLLLPGVVLLALAAWLYSRNRTKDGKPAP